MTEIEPEFTLDELLAELVGPDVPLDGYYTIGEWATRLGINRHKADQLLHRAHQLGKLRTTRQTRPAMDGSKRPVPVYSFVLKESES